MKFITFKTILDALEKQREVDRKINGVLQLAQADTYFMGTTIDDIGKAFDKVFLDAYGEDGIDLIHWWVFEDVEKCLFDNDGQVIDDLTTMVALWEYLENINTSTKEDEEKDYPGDFDGVGGYGSSGRKPLPRYEYTYPARICDDEKHDWKPVRNEMSSDGFYSRDVCKICRMTRELRE